MHVFTHFEKDHGLSGFETSVIKNGNLCSSLSSSCFRGVAGLETSKILCFTLAHSSGHRHIAVRYFLASNIFFNFDFFKKIFYGATYVFVTHYWPLLNREYVIFSNNVMISREFYFIYHF